MGQRSTISRLPRELRENIGRLLDDGHTIDEMMAKLAELGVDNVSRSAMGRYAKSMREVSERLRRGRHMADALVQRYGEDNDNRQLRLNLELMQSIITDCFCAEDEGGALKLEPAQARMLAQALRDLSTARKNDFELHQKLVQTQKQNSAKIAEQAAISQGMRHDKARLIREAVEGAV